MNRPLPPGSDSEVNHNNGSDPYQDVERPHQHILVIFYGFHDCFPFRRVIAGTRQRRHCRRVNGRGHRCL